jgi:hydrogenase maturation protein HypF
MHRYGSRMKNTFSRLRIEIEGIVQGVGFRPFVFRLAARHGITGSVRNISGCVQLEAQGMQGDLTDFLRAIENEAPPLASITAIRQTEISPRPEKRFLIRPSAPGEHAVHIAPDGSVCADCLEELFAPGDRRYRYPFINCTNCGPRYSIITGIPYDRPFTTMASFAMCSDCRAEYDKPESRRFHAQPNSCPECGPRLRLVGRDGRELAGDAITNAVSLLKGGKILAVKGTGGFHLAVDARNEEAVCTLRRRKQRDEKPFAVMVPDLAASSCHVRSSNLERRLLDGQERPIVVIPRLSGSTISPEVAPANGYFGIMLPATPIQHLLLHDTATPLVMTSGNLSDEPIVHRDHEALARLAGIADFFLIHDREIHTFSDDSVIRVFQGNPLFMRRSRGYAPRPVFLPSPQKSVMAVGGELKNAICLTAGNRGYMSQHFGDLKNAATRNLLEETAAHLMNILGITPEVIGHDLHPDYLSTAFAENFADIPRVAIQHHHAHMAACMAENRLDGDVIGVIYDGAGYGLDAHIWGGEFLLGNYRTFRRSGHFRYVPLPGGDAVVRETWRMAISYLYDSFGEDLFAHPLAALTPIGGKERKLLLAMLKRGINSPLSSSCGRLFDAVAALIGLRSTSSYEGQAAIELEAAAEGSEPAGLYPFEVSPGIGTFTVDFRLMISAILRDVAAGQLPSVMARRFNDTLAAATAEACRLIGRESGVTQVVLSGGVFQNKLLTEKAYELLVKEGFQVFTHRLVPPNDGGLALGQAVIAGQQVYGSPDRLFGDDGAEL